MRSGLARSISIAGHPLLLMPLATLLAAASRGADAATVHTLLVLVCALGAGLFGYAWWQVRRGRWLHVDASRQDERRQLNRVLLLVLGVGAAWALHAAGPSPLVLALAAATAIVALALLLARWLKLSLHVAFAVFAALLPAWPAATAVLAVLAAAVAWSRLALHRHSRGEVLAGALAGVAAGLVFRIA
ncbi:MAG: phosphoesterase [Rhodanobacteraceae bacterium]|jgi:membrane-associated phospholipid phosphatase|nr:phosphoesterase [Rhodanobacteraceae bacterium]